MTPVTAYVGLGANLGDPRSQLLDALDRLSHVVGVSTVRRSGLYRSEPLGPAGQPDYLNAAASIQTTLRPMSLLSRLQGLEQLAGRKRLQRWGPRSLDLDLLSYGSSRIDGPALTIPHPRIHERLFVLRPLADLDEGLLLPGQGRVCDLLQHCPPLRVSPVPWE